MGKVQTLETGLSFLWKAPKGKINPMNLGWVCPDGTINFATPEAANKYAKNTVVKALNATKPYEKSVVVDGKRIMFEQAGTAVNCLVPLDSKGTWVHGHPDWFGKGRTMPFSATDYDAFMSRKNIDEAVIYNSTGEESRFVKKTRLSFLDKLLLKLIPSDKYDIIKTQAQIGMASGGYNQALLDCNVETSLKLNKLAMQRTIAMMKGNAVQAEKYGLEYEKIYNQKLEAALKDDEVAQKLHKFWEKNQRKLGIEYSSNFSNLS